MQTVFISGSIKIRALKTAFLERLDNITESDDLRVVVGDANGADKLVQKALKDRATRAVSIYCAGETPRNNLGDWPVRVVSSKAKPGTREFFTAKDRAMAEDADYGLMVWDCKSTGTLTNVLELVRRGKGSRVFIQKAGKFVTIKEADDVDGLLALMDDEARKMARHRIEPALWEGQTAMAL